MLAAGRMDYCLVMMQGGAIKVSAAAAAAAARKEEVILPLLEGEQIFRQLPG